MTQVGNLRVYDLRRSSGYSDEFRKPIKTISIHHWAGLDLAEDATIDAELGAIRIVDQQHLNQGWPGIGYHFVACQSGRIYYVGDISELRYNTGPKGNPETIAIALPGNFMENPPSARHLAVVRSLVAELQYVLGWFVPVVPHKFYGGTQCPGDTWDSWKDAVTIEQPSTERIFLLDASSPDQRNADADLIQEIADEYQIEAVDLLALAIAEADPVPGRLFNPTARRPLLAEDDQRFWPDVSGGPAQQTVRSSPEYIGRFGRGYSAYPGPDFVEQVLSKYYDPAYALRIAASKLSEKLVSQGNDFVRAACLYNRPVGDPDTNPNRQRYVDSYERAKVIWYDELGR